METEQSYFSQKHVTHVKHVASLKNKMLDFFSKIFIPNSLFYDIVTLLATPLKKCRVEKPNPRMSDQMPDAGDETILANM
jgi:histidinol phosphatase-like enzyme